MEADQETGFGLTTTFPPPALVSLSPFPSLSCPSPRRLSSHFTPPTRPIRAARQLAWVSLQGRLVGAEEASSARAIGGGLNPEEAVAWELFTPIHRILIVAVIAVAASNSKKNKQIYQLTKSVQIRDEVLSGMQQKLDNLCEQVNSFKDQPEVSAYGLKFSGCGCRQCDHHLTASSHFGGDSAVKSTDEDKMINYKTALANDVEPEERRMSSLSDWAPSVSSSVDIQWNTLDVDQEMDRYRRECEDKDATIRELSTLLRSSDVIGSKRIAELEDIIRRKNTMITRLKKDIMVLQEKVMHLTRLKRPSLSTSSSHTRKLPLMADNIVYDMDSTTSPSSSDSDCPPKTQHQSPVVKEDPVLNFVSTSRGNQKSGQSKNSKFPIKSSEQPPRSRPISPLKENSKFPIKSSERPPRSRPISPLKENSKFPIKSSERPPRSRPISPLNENSMNQQLSSLPVLRSKSSSLSASRDFTSKRHNAANSTRIAASPKKWV